MSTVLKSRFKKEPVVSQFPVAMAIVPRIEAKKTPTQPRTLVQVYIPKSLRLLWTQFKRPPMQWNSLGAYNQLDRMIEP